VTHPQNWQQK